MAFLKNMLKPPHNYLEISLNNISILLKEFFFSAFETNKSSGRTNRPPNCSAGVNLGRTLIDSFVFMDSKSSPKSRLHRRTNRRINRLPAVSKKASAIADTELIIFEANLWL